MEWSKYKYSVLEHSPSEYNAIRKLLRNKEAYPAVQFYERLEGAMSKECNPGNSINAMQHVWGYFRDTATESEKSRFLKYVEEYSQGNIESSKLKRFLNMLAEKYKEPYLMNSYYFLFD